MGEIAPLPQIIQVIQIVINRKLPGFPQTAVDILNGNSLVGIILKKPDNFLLM